MCGAVLADDFSQGKIQPNITISYPGIAENVQHPEILSGSNVIVLGTDTGNRQ